VGNLNGYPEIKDWITYGLSLASIIVTGIFSYFIFRVTRDSTKAAIKSAEVAEASYLFNQSLTIHQKELEGFISKQYFESIKEKALLLSQAVISQNSTSLNGSMIKNAPRKHGLTEVEFTKYLTSDQQDIVKQIWNQFNYYLAEYWITPNGDLKATFNGEEVSNIIQGSKITGDALMQLIVELANSQNP
jgi:hypothetical protein